MALELTPDDVKRIERLVGGAVHITCRRYNLRKDQVGEDMAQDCWVEVLRVKDRYDPGRGAALITFLYLSVFRRCARFAEKELRRNAASVQLGDHHSVSFDGPLDSLERAERLVGADVRVAASAMGFSDAEIATMLDEPERETTRLRRSAQRELAG